MMTRDQLFDAIRVRIADPALRITPPTTHPPRLYDPASAAALAKAERDLGFTLPPLLRAVYAEIANGGFGPGYGMLGVEGGHTGYGKTIAGLYNEFRSSGEPYVWPEGLLPLWEWGCTIWSCLDARTTEGPIVTHEGMTGQTETAYTLHSWLEAWVADINLWDEFFEWESVPTINPFTRKPSTASRIVRAKGKPWVPGGGA
jgi:hypothetical protein